MPWRCRRALERAALENVGIYRDGSLEGADIVAMGQDKMLFTGDASENPLLQAGDIIYVPETKNLIGQRFLASWAQSAHSRIPC